MNPSPKSVLVKTTPHACLRYAQRVLGRASMTLEALLANPDIHARCRRGIERVARDAELVGVSRPGTAAPGTMVVLRRTCALVLRGGWVLTVLVSQGPRGFGKPFLRRYEFGQPGPDLALAA